MKTKWLSLLCFCSIALGQMNPQSKEITQKFFPEIDSLSNVTPALKKPKGYTNYEELIAYFNDLAQKHPSKITLKYIGESQNGLKIPMVFLHSNKTESTVRVFMQGGLHGDEPASTEGLLYLMHQLLNNPKHAQILEKIELGIVPMANIDGFLKNERTAANGLDLNRDQTKLMAPETVVLKEAVHTFNPAVVLDFHEYRPYRKDFTKFGSFGVTGRYDVMFLYSGNLNVPKNIRDYTKDVFVKNAKDYLNHHQFSNYDYFTTNTYDGHIQFDLGSVSARSSASSYALQNKISTLIEVRGVGIGKTSFKRRTLITYLIGLSYLNTTLNEIHTITSVIELAHAQRDSITIKSKKEIYKDKLDFIDLDANEIIKIDITLRNALQSKATESRSRPLGYYLDSDQKNLVEKLSQLGYTVETLTEAKDVSVEHYKVIAYEKEPKKYEKANIQNVSTEIHLVDKSFPKGTFYVNLNQKGSSLITELLEPEMPNSFVSFGVLMTNINEILPIYRHIN
jgi:hypothetical protein